MFILQLIPSLNVTSIYINTIINISTQNFIVSLLYCIPGRNVGHHIINRVLSNFYINSTKSSFKAFCKTLHATAQCWVRWVIFFFFSVAIIPCSSANLRESFALKYLWLFYRYLLLYLTKQMLTTLHRDNPCWEWHISYQSYRLIYIWTGSLYKIYSNDLAVTLNYWPFFFWHTLPCWSQLVFKPTLNQKY